MLGNNGNFKMMINLISKNLRRRRSILVRKKNSKSWKNKNKKWKWGKLVENPEKLVENSEEFLRKLKKVLFQLRLNLYRTSRIWRIFKCRLVVLWEIMKCRLNKRSRKESTTLNLSFTHLKTYPTNHHDQSNFQHHNYRKSKSDRKSSSLLRFLNSRSAHTFSFPNL